MELRIFTPTPIHDNDQGHRLRSESPVTNLPDASPLFLRIELARLEHYNARYLSIYQSIFLSFGYVCLQFVVYASLILDTLPFHESKDFNCIDAPDKAINW